MEIKHLRKFLPVGHGAFFIERLSVDGQRVLTVVYDCGDSNQGKEVQQYAIKEFGTVDKPGELIDLLFISHFDDDHVNGLKYIQPYLTPNTKVFLPFFYAHLQSVYNQTKRNGISYVIDILNQVHIKPIHVRYRVADRQAGSIDVDEYDPEQSGNEISSGFPLVKSINSQPIWKFVPFNLFNEQTHYTDFKNKVHSVLHWTDSKLYDATKWTKQDIKALRNIYNSFNRLTINDNSLIVLSDAFGDLDRYYVEVMDQDYLHLALNYPNCMWYNHPQRPSILYTGDTVLKRGVRKSKYSDRYEDFLNELKMHTNHISMMQIPHHGSVNNINMSALCDCLSLQMFCNFATSDMRFGSFMLQSPTIDTLWKNVIMVTEDVATVYEQMTKFNK